MYTECSICGKPLSDPVSMEIGMGPVCRIMSKQLTLANKTLNMFQTKSKFNWGTKDDVLWIVDLDEGLSVTNDMGNVLSSIQEELGDLSNHKIIYQDSMGIWDQVILNGSTKNVSFKALTEKTLEGAISKVR